MPEWARKSIRSESVWKAAESLISKQGRVSGCGLNARWCAGQNAIELIKFS
jgi:hypothetical protein